MLRHSRRVHPARRLFYNRLYARVLYHDLDVDGVVHLSEYQSLLSVLEFEVIEQLEPEVFEFVRVVFEQIEVVAHCAQDLVELRVKFPVWLGNHADKLLLIWIIAVHGLCYLVN